MRKSASKIWSVSTAIKTFLSKSDVGMVLFIEIFVGVVLTSFSALFFAKLSHTVLSEQRFFFDSLITQLVLSLRSAALTDVMIVISMIGSTGVVIGSVIVLGYLVLTKHRKEAVIYSAMVLMGAGINTLLKFIVQRPRPGEFALVTETNFSFPSGHSMDSFIFFLTIAYFAFHFTRSKTITTVVTIVSICLVLLIGLSRIYLGVHYPSDVLGGYVAGFIWFTTIIVLDRTLIFYRLFKETRK